LSLGTFATAVGRSALALGPRTNALDDRSLAIGYLAQANGEDACAVGSQFNVYPIQAGTRSTAIGNSSGAAAADAVAIGFRSSASEDCSLALGSYSLASYWSTAVGCIARAESTFPFHGSIAIGGGAEASAAGAICIASKFNVYTPTASGEGAIAIGTYVQASGNYAIAIGGAATGNEKGAQAIGERSMALGHLARTMGNSGIALGAEAEAEADRSIAVGDGVVVTGQDSVAIGTNADGTTMTLSESDAARVGGEGVGLYRERKVERFVADDALTALESDKVCHNEGASTMPVLTLPSASAGRTYTFVVGDAVGIRARALAGDGIRLAGAVSSAGGYVQSTTVGDALTLVAVNESEWVAVALVGTGWTAF
jgi:hypothetical protein